MRKDLFASLTSKIAVGVVAVLLTAGTGGAVVFSNANHESPGPNENANDHATENVNDDHESDDEGTNEAESESENEANENSTDNHGSDVRVAAHSDDDHGCANHGQYVASIARDDECKTELGNEGGDASSNADDDHGQSGDDHGKSGDDHPSDDDD
jgi:hypothetical protein